MPVLQWQICVVDSRRGAYHDIGGQWHLSIVADSGKGLWPLGISLNMSVRAEGVRQ